MAHPLVERFEALLRENAPQLLDAFEPPAAPEALEEAAEFVGDLAPLWVELHAWRDGSGQSGSVWQGLEWLSLSSSRSIKETMDGLDEDGTFDRWAPHEWWNPGWVPVFDNRSYDTYVIDTVGSFDGEPGQLLRWSKDGPERPAIAPSFQAWLETFCDLIEEGVVVWNAHEGGFVGQDHALVEDLITARLDGFPRDGEARTRRSLGMTRTPKPAERIECAEGFAADITHQVWAPGEAAVTCMEWLDELGLLAVGQSARGDVDCGALSLVDPATGQVVRQIHPAGGRTLAVRWLPDRRQLAYLLSASGRQIWVWDEESDATHQLVGNTHRHDTFTFGAAGRYILYAGEAVRLYDLDTGEERTVPVARNERVSAAITPTADRLAVHLPDGPMRLFAITEATIEVVDEWPVDSAKFSKLRFDRHGEVLSAMARPPKNVERFTISGEPITIANPPYFPYVIAYAPHGGLWAAAGNAGPVTIHDREGNQLYLDNPHGRTRVHGLAFDASGERLFSGGQDGQIATRRLG